MALHTITVSLQGNVSVSESVEMNDAEALPLFIRLKAVLQSGETPKPVRRKARTAGRQTKYHAASVASDKTNGALKPEEAR